MLPRVFEWNSNGVFSMSSAVKKSMTSFPAFTMLLVQSLPNARGTIASDRFAKFSEAGINCSLKTRKMLQEEENFI